MNNIDKLVDLEKKIQYKFQDFGLLEMAMRHSSYANEHHMERLECNERLEFLGCLLYTSFYNRTSFFVYSWTNGVPVL